MSKFGIYVHIPYCLQRCVYCDFSTYELSQILGPSEYIKRVQNEIKTTAPQIKPRPLDTLYFGGGTPSLLDPPLLWEIIRSLKEEGFSFKPNTEITLEINPATINDDKLRQLIQMGFNRFSVGAQTFDDKLLKISNRRHSAQETIETLGLLKSRGLNYSLDLLFALPQQDLKHLQKDIEQALHFQPQHISPYCLTVPETNPMAKNRAPEGVQVEMFELIKNELQKAGLERYEISNFAKPGFESRHNMLYWDDDEYWGIGLSSHSYMRWGAWGSRFWNPRGIQDYINKMPIQTERLEKHQALTDFFHISLRKSSGLDKAQFKNKFKTDVEVLAGKQIEKLTKKGWLTDSGNKLSLTEQGIVLSNQVFEEFTFLSSSG